MNSRYYDSSTGRFLTQDSYSGSPYDPWTQHLYSYCGNNPVNMVDPTGHSFIAVLAITMGILLVANIARECNVNKPELQEKASKMKKNTTVKPSSPKYKPKGYFGAESSLDLEKESAASTNDLLIGKDNGVASVGITHGTKVNKKILSEGDSTQPISAYVKNVNGNITKSSAGIKTNQYSLNNELMSTTDYSVGLSNFGMSHTSMARGTNQSYGAYVNLSFERVTANIGFTYSVENSGVITTDYTELNVNIVTAIFAYVAAPVVAASGTGIAIGRMAVDILG